MASSTQQHAVIVGAGVIGLLAARELRQRGWRVSVFDAGEAGRESSWAGGGILSPILPWQYPEPVWWLARRSLALYPALAAELAADTGVDPEHLPSGALVLDDAQHAEGQAWHARQQLPASRVVVRPGPSPERPALALPWVGQIRNPRLGRALRLDLQRRGVALHEHEPVLGWLQEPDRVTGVRTARRELRGDRVVLAAGAWSGALGALPVAPVRGQMLLLRLARERLRPIVLAPGGRYLIPRADGRVLAGSTVEHVGFDKAVTAAAASALLDFAADLLGDDVRGCVEAQWGGLRPGAADGVPYIGEHPRLAGLWACTGHYRNGLVMAPASAELLADLLERRPTQVEAGDYRLTPARLAAAAPT